MDLYAELIEFEKQKNTHSYALTELRPKLPHISKLSHLRVLLFVRIYRQRLHIIVWTKYCGMYRSLKSEWEWKKNTSKSIYANAFPCGIADNCLDPRTERTEYKIQPFE